MIKELRVKYGTNVDLSRQEPHRFAIYVKNDRKWYDDTVGCPWYGFYIKYRAFYSHQDGDDYVFVIKSELTIVRNNYVRVLIGNDDVINKFADRYQRIIERSGLFKKSKRKLDNIVPRMVNIH